MGPLWGCCDLGCNLRESSFGEGFEKHWLWSQTDGVPGPHSTSWMSQVVNVSEMGIHFLRSTYLVELLRVSSCVQAALIIMLLSDHSTLRTQRLINRNVSQLGRLGSPRPRHLQIRWLVSTCFLDSLFIVILHGGRELRGYKSANPVQQASSLII